MVVTVETSRSVHCSSRRVGMGSNPPVLDCANAVSSETVSNETLSNNESSHILRTEHDCVEDVGERNPIQHCSSCPIFSSSPKNTRQIYSPVLRASYAAVVGFLLVVWEMVCFTEQGLLISTKFMNFEQSKKMS